jgi:hypothetical protein
MRNTTQILLRKSLIIHINKICVQVLSVSKRIVHIVVPSLYHKEYNTLLSLKFVPQPNVFVPLGVDKFHLFRLIDVFQESNIEFLKSIPKIVTEFHLNNDSNYHECKFRWFRDNILPQFDNIQIYTVDGIDIKWNL